MENSKFNMKRDWNMIAQKEATWFIDSSSKDDLKEFFKIGAQQVNMLIGELQKRGFEPAGKKVLEIGCGTGRQTRALAEMFGEVVAIDVSGEMIQQASSLNSDLKNVSFIETSGRDLSEFSDNSFDLVYSYIVLGHIPEKEIVDNYFREFYRVLQEGGSFIIELPRKLGMFSPGGLTLVWTFGLIPIPRFLTRILPRSIVDIYGYALAHHRLPPMKFRKLVICQRCFTNLGMPACRRKLGTASIRPLMLSST